MVDAGLMLDHAVSERNYVQGYTIIETCDIYQSLISTMKMKQQQRSAAEEKQDGPHAIVIVDHGGNKQHFQGF
jgi:hypothetical protein